MSITIKSGTIDGLMMKASEALARTAYFEAERLALKALGMARQVNDFERMARIVLPLQEARRQRLQQALDIGTVSIVDTPVTEEMRIVPGCHLVQPPQVGADARRLRLAAIAAEIPVAVLCREPLTQLRLQPIVAISPNITLRTKVRPPADHEAPSLDWFCDTLEAMGDWAIESIDPEMDVVKRVDGLVDRLDAIPDHEKLHQALEATCREARRAALAEAEEAATKGSRKRVKS